ncbi:DUF5719 family protein [Gryllotalpicola ginsengisoli]|uniref:DUF5719 family protein n=1 Tax=Gryllotalpicola ginsengisoli TaxID=444608 RepID=UPI0003B6D55F|nr:DUF5719 family protein [Gryllotalpicola ginsengisoli]
MTARALTTIGGRAAVGVIGLAASAALVGAAFTVPIADTTAADRPAHVTPVPADAQAACPGGLLSLATGGTATSLSTIGQAATTAGGSSALGSPTQLKASDVSGTGNDPIAYSVPAKKGASSAPLIAAAQSERNAGSEVNGIAAALCPEPVADSWLSAGSASLGETGLVLLTNPNAVAANVDLDVYSESGHLDAPGTQGILVQPHSQKVVSLAGIAPDASATVIHVTSHGGTVVADLQQSSVAGVTPQGVEVAGVTASPSTHLVIPGVASSAAAQTQAASDDDSSALVLRVYVPGSKSAKITVSTRAEQGSKGGVNPRTVTLDPGVVSEVPITGLGDGTYTITVDSSVPVVGSAKSTIVGSSGTDFAWYAAARTLSGAVAIPVAHGPSGVLHLMNPGRSAVSLTLGGAGGGKKVAVGAGASVGVPITKAGVITVADAHGVYASVGYRGDGLAASYTIAPPGANASPLDVYTQ